MATYPKERKRRIGHFAFIDTDGSIYRSDSVGANKVDEITGLTIHSSEIGIQDGLVKSMNPSDGSWEKYSVETRHDIWWLVPYDGAVQSKAAGE